MILLLLTAGVLDPLTARLENTVLLQGGFVQTETWALTRESETTRGTLSFAHPNLFLLEYTDPPGRVTGCDGETVYTIEPLYREVVRYTDADPVGFLHLLLRAGEEGMGVETLQRGDTLSVTVTGDLGGGIHAMAVSFLQSDSLPLRFATSDINGNRTEWELQDLVFRNSFSPDLFRLSVPTGYTVLQEGP